MHPYGQKNQKHTHLNITFPVNSAGGISPTKELFSMCLPQEYLVRFKLSLGKYTMK